MSMSRLLLQPPKVMTRTGSIGGSVAVMNEEMELLKEDETVSIASHACEGSLHRPRCGHMKFETTFLKIVQLAARLFWRELDWRRISRIRGRAKQAAEKKARHDCGCDGTRGGENDT